MSAGPVRVLVVCSGNICRSPTAEAVLRAQAQAAGLAVIVDSAGTGAWHVGDPADPRSAAAARRRGYRLDGTARQVRAEDFESFDLIVAVDRRNLDKLARLAPEGSTARLRMLGPDDVPDPYYDGAAGFENVLTLIEGYCAQLLLALRADPEAR